MSLQAGKRNEKKLIQARPNGFSRASFMAIKKQIIHK